MATLFGMFPFLQKLFADGGYQGSEFTTALATVRPHLNVEIVKRSDRAKGSKAIRRTFGAAAAIQSCQVHKARNIMERLPKSLHASVRRVLRQAWERTMPTRPKS
jgi:hypothetical protein